MTSGPDILRRLAIPVPAVEFGGGRGMARLLHSINRDLAVKTRSALEGGSIDELIDSLDRAEPWPQLASAVHLAAEVVAHIVDSRRAAIPTRTPTDDST